MKTIRSDGIPKIQNNRIDGNGEILGKVMRKKMWFRGFAYTS